LAAMKKYTFIATGQPGMHGGAAVVFPNDVEQEFGTQERVPVKATIDGVPYTGSLVRCGTEGHLLDVLKDIREQIGKGSGDTVEVVLWKDEEVRTVEAPVKLERLLKEHCVLVAFEKLSYTNRKENCRWVSGAQREETCRIRLEKSIEMLNAGIKTPG